MSDGTPKSKGGRLAPGRSNLPSAPGPAWTKGEKPRNFRRAIKELFGYIGNYRWIIIICVALSMLSSIITMLGPQYIKEISDMILDGIYAGHIDEDKIFSLAMVVVIIYLASVLLNTFVHYFIPATSERIANLLRRDLAHKINQLPLNYYDNSSTGDIMSRLTNDADTIGETCGHSVNLLLTASTTLIGVAAIMLYTNLALGLVAVVPTICGYIIIRLVVRYTHKFYIRQSRNLGAMNGHVEEVYYGHDIIRAYNGEEITRERFVEINNDLYRTTFVSRFITSTLPQVTGFVNNIGYALVCVVGTMLFIKGEISYGVIVAFIVYVRMFNQPMLQLSDGLASMQSLAASSERVFDLLNAPEMEDESSKVQTLDDIKGDIEFRDVSFSYIEGIEVIHHFSLDVKAGQKVAIVGPTGAGKTTLVNLLMRFYELDAGDILIDGISTKDLRREQVHSAFSMVLQDAWLFDGTVMDNLVFNKPEMNREKVYEACRSVGIHDFIMGLPKQYDTVLSDSVGLSAGQKQQISIARAIILDAPMIIFDEATSSVDTRTEKIIQKAVDKLTDGRTSFVIAHRLSTIKNCDIIIVMKDGRMAETGTHEELLEKGGFYADLYNSQFENCA